MRHASAPALLPEGGSVRSCRHLGSSVVARAGRPIDNIRWQKGTAGVKLLTGGEREARAFCANLRGARLPEHQSAPPGGNFLRCAPLLLQGEKREWQRPRPLPVVTPGSFSKRTIPPARTTTPWQLVSKRGAIRRLLLDRFSQPLLGEHGCHQRHQPARLYAARAYRPGL